jgi:integrase
LPSSTPRGLPARGPRFCGLKFFFERTLEKEWTTFGLVRPAPEKKLPVILSLAEVRQLLGCIRLVHYRVCLTTIYACGLRLQEGTHLQVADIDSARMMIHVRHGKGAKDRYVPLPQRTLELLRQYWVTHRNPVLLFPSSGRHGEVPLATWVCSTPGPANSATTPRSLPRHRRRPHTGGNLEIFASRLSRSGQSALVDLPGQVS